MLSLGFRGGSGISGLGCKVHGVGVKGLQSQHAQ